MKTPTQLQVDQERLRQGIVSGFDEGELRTLCYDLKIDYDTLRDEGKEAKARELIAHCERRGRTLELVRACQQRRPKTRWLDVVQEIEVASPTLSPPPSVQAPPGSTSSRRAWPPYVVGGVGGLILAALLWLLLINPKSPLKSRLTSTLATAPPPPVSLVGMGFEVGEYNLRLVDLRSVADVGIPASPGRLLQFLDLWVSIPEDAPEYQVQAEIYENPELSSLIGVTELMVPLQAGNVGLGDIKVTAFQDDPDDEDADTWRVPSHWKDLYVVLVTYRDGQPVDLATTKIHFDDNGLAWLLDPPNASFASIVYSVNGGPAQVLDLRGAVELGLNATAGDTLTLFGVWYHANASSSGDDDAIRAEAYLSAEGYDDSALCRSGFYLVERGIQELELDNVTCNHDEDATSFRWIIPEDKEILVVSLIRFDGALLDRLVLPFGGLTGSPGLVPRAGTVTWPTDYTQFLDFEQESELVNWTKNVARAPDYALTGNYSLQITQAVTEEFSSIRFTNWEQAFTADALVIHYYLPSTPDVDIDWAEFCVLGHWGDDCKSMDETRDQWHTVVFDFYRWPEGAEPLWNEVEMPGLAVLGELAAPGATEPVSYSIYLDAIQIFEDDNP